MPKHIDAKPRSRPRRQRRRGPLALLLAVCTVTLAWAGMLPNQLVAIKPLDLTQPDAWFVDVRLAAIARNRPLCAATIASPAIAAAPIADNPYVDGCGWQNAVRLSQAGNARIALNALTCEAAAATALWVAHVVQPQARRHLGSTVSAIQPMGGYACRNIVGNKLWSDFRSQHATANAIDIAGFVLQDGRTITIKKFWTTSGAEAAFLRAVHDGACQYFRAVLGPNYNSAHHDHFHFDRGYIRSCK